MKYILFLISVLYFQIGHCQYKLVPLTKADRKNGIIRHYQIVSEYASAHLFLFRSHRFRFENYACLGGAYSEGCYRQEGNDLIFESDYPKRKVPAEIVYRQRTPADSFYKKMLPAVDMDNKILDDGVVYVNNDSTGCIYGDADLYPELNSMDSVKIKFSNGISTAWIKVKPTEEIFQIKLLAQLVPLKYLAYNLRHRMKGDMLLIEKE